MGGGPAVNNLPMMDHFLNRANGSEVPAPVLPPNINLSDDITIEPVFNNSISNYPSNSNGQASDSGVSLNLASSQSLSNNNMAHKAATGHTPDFIPPMKNHAIVPDLTLFQQQGVMSDPLARNNAATGFPLDNGK